MNFNLTESQLEKLIDWDDIDNGHICNYNLLRENKAGGKFKYYGSIDSHLTFIITPRIIGHKVVVKCNLCGSSIDLSEIYDDIACN